jgi:hypothetical protein
MSPAVKVETGVTVSIRINTTVKVSPTAGMGATEEM